MVLGILVAAALSCFFLDSGAAASPRDSWLVPSPDHGQTFAYGSETHRLWTGWGRHLGVVLDFTNDPYVDQVNPRQYDKFSFSFPDVTLGKDGHTFFYRSSGGRAIPVAEKRRDFLGVDEIKLLPNAGLIVNKSHGYLSLFLSVEESEAQN